MALTHLSFDASYYMTARPDVLTAYVNAGAEAGTGMNWAQFAEQHYNDFGWKEGYNPNAIFDTSEYLAANLDVLDAGVNPFQHYLQFGAYEKRAPSDSFISFEDFDWETYLGANSDLTDAGIETAEDAYGHYVLFGQFEVRDGKPEEAIPSVPGETYTLSNALNFSTGGVDKIAGTADNDTIRAILQGSLNSADVIDGGAGDDVLNISQGAIGDVFGSPSAAPVIKNVETINNKHVSGLVFNNAAFDPVVLDLDEVDGLKELWTNFADVNWATAVADYGTAGVGAAYKNVSNGTVIGVSNVAAQANIDPLLQVGGNVGKASIAFAGTGPEDTLNIALKGNAAGSYYSVGQGSLDVVETVNITAAAGNSGTLALNNKVEAINVTGAGDLAFVVQTYSELESFNASGSTGRIEFGNLKSLGTITLGEDAELLGGSGNDTFVVSSGTNDITVSGGAGADTLNVASSTGDIIVSGGAGKDDITVASTSGDVTVIGGAGADEINLTNAGSGDVTVVYTAQTDSTYVNFDEITGFSAGATGDVIDLSAFDFAGETDAITNGNTTTTNTTIGQFAVTDVADFYGDNAVAVWTDGAGANTYVFADVNNDGHFNAATDLVIKVVGTGLTVANFDFGAAVA